MSKLSSWKTIFCLFVVCTEAAISSPAQTFTTLHAFKVRDGANPYGGLVQGKDGNFYGTTQEGGAYDAGTVFKMTSGGSLTTLYSFCFQTNCPDGHWPEAGLVQATDGNFYGTTRAGGANNNCYDYCGTIFKVTSWGSLTTLYSFCSQTSCTDGSMPSGLVQATDGNFYGTTRVGGATEACGDASCGNGTVFKMTADGTLTTLYTFCSQPGCTDGGGAQGALIQAADGNFYGTTGGGGIGYGTVFKITPQGALTTLHSFENYPYDGADPNGALVQATDGNFYGTTYSGGANDFGTIFKITGGGTLTILHSFSNLTQDDGVFPQAGLVQATDGKFYGTTTVGGISPCPFSGYCSGTVFVITAGATQFTLHNFNGKDGSAPMGPLVQATDGKLYGTTSDWEGPDFGTIFSLSAGPLASASPDQLVFANQNVGTMSASQQVTLNNDGDAKLTVTSVGVTNSFGETDNCVGTVAAGSSCTIDLTFSPTASGALIGTLTIADNSNGVAGSKQMVELLATGIAAVARVAPPRLTFSGQNVGTTSASQAVTLSNTGTATLRITSIATSAKFGETNTCGGGVAAGSSCTIDVTFSPTATGTLSGTLTITDDSNGVAGSTQTVALTGMVASAAASLSAPSFFFGTQVINTASPPKEVTLASTGTANLSISSITITGTNASDFAQTNNCPASMAPAAKCTISLTYTPSVQGAESASLTLTDNTANSPQVVALTGTGFVRWKVSPVRP